MVDRILIPLDGSQTAEAVLPQVRRILQRHPAEVILVQAVFVPPDIHFSGTGNHDEAEKYIRKMTFQFVHNGIPAKGFVREGRPADSIVDLAREKDASMIALATHGRTGLGRWVFGSIAEEVLRASPVPVFVARSFHPATGQPMSRGKLESLPFHNILVPLDAGEACLGILPILRDLAKPLDARVTLLHVGAPTGVDGLWPPTVATMDQAEKILTESCIPAQQLFRKGNPADEILKTCAEQSIDLIALASHGRSGPARWVLGSVAESVLRAATVPLLVAHTARQAGVTQTRQESTYA